MASAIGSSAARNRALFVEELRAAEAQRNDARAELVALNAVLRAHGPPAAVFGAVEGVAPGLLLTRRAELCVLGVHRHFLSEMSYTLQGVESVLVGPSAALEDFGERLILHSRGGKQQNMLMHALRVNETGRLPVRVTRTVESGEVHERAPRSHYRYDGLYLVRRYSDELMDTLSGHEAPRYLLLRAPNQPPLPIGVGRRRPAAVEEETDGALSLHGALAERPPTTVLPPAAEEVLGADPVTLGEAIRRLRAARDELVGGLAPHEAYLLARRSALNQTRLRAAIDLLHADGAPACARAGGWATIAHGA